MIITNIMENRNLKRHNSRRQTRDIRMSEDPSKKQERGFQLEMLRLRLKYGIIGSVMTILYSAAISYLVAIITIGISIPNTVNLTNLILFLIVVLITSVVLSVVLVACGIKKEIAKLGKQFC